MTAPNPMVGEAEFRGLKLRMDFDRWCALEYATGRKMPQLCVDFERGLGLSDLKTWLRCFAVGEVTEEQLSATIHQGAMLADYEAATKVFGDMMNSFFQPPKKEDDERPLKAA